MIVGTPAYMSPEQAQGERKLDGRSDVYSLGVILYELLAGQFPYTGNTHIEIISNLISPDPVPPPSSVGSRKRVDRPLENICLKALAKQLENRFQTAGEFANSLSRWLEGDRVGVRPPAARSVSRRNVRRHRRRRRTR